MPLTCHMRIGTSHFVSIGAARRYYAHAGYGYAAGRRAADEKVAAGEIHIGPPSLKSDETSGIDLNGRYEIQVWHDLPEKPATLATHGDSAS